MRTPLLALALLASAHAYAHDETPCTKEPAKQWQPFSEAIKKAEQAGHTVKVAEVHHRCYEIRGVGKDGKRFEWVLDPVTLSPRSEARK
ncbi:PepSY domain-containing protein [Chitinimonas sp. BJYL2]|uniref:PepSY domain-containing protein n=1 Tax=Chitinimonas sp. BJYL2 TaxID=2976696 RepID=UPI0022B5DCB3|nr:PepSY domain-containing protein [Chitinimonas sp. BJYL2]